MHSIVLGGGGFGCVEGALKGLRGVSEVIPGYSGGHVENPTYAQVCGKRTGHAEVVRVNFDAAVIDMPTVLEVFFTCHDPTQLNRQGNDIGPQYRSAAFYSGDEQKSHIEDAIEKASILYDSPIVTEVSPLINFFVAEDYHHDYFTNNPGNPYCRMVVAPKIAKTRAKPAPLYD